ncbi:uncharacterized protein LOC119930715 [Tachyglossus aculeatus]|uniref:uncharacterized protein LOC119930715 n=1 Tax=Tachyglossus aculeatus TaxID=9261 RepID=UPI0018F79BB0|nr:uncharacterized protein LOC119930715 [Tachyglossus aculeatus]
MMSCCFLWAPTLLSIALTMSSITPAPSESNFPLFGIKLNSRTAENEKNKNPLTVPSIQFHWKTFVAGHTESDIFWLNQTHAIQRMTYMEMSERSQGNDDKQQSQSTGKILILNCQTRGLHWLSSIQTIQESPIPLKLSWVWTENGTTHSYDHYQANAQGQQLNSFSVNVDSQFQRWFHCCWQSKSLKNCNNRVDFRMKDYKFNSFENSSIGLKNNVKQLDNRVELKRRQTRDLDPSQGIMELGRYVSGVVWANTGGEAVFPCILDLDCPNTALSNRRNDWFHNSDLVIASEEQGVMYGIWGKGVSYTNPDNPLDISFKLHEVSPADEGPYEGTYAIDGIGIAKCIYTLKVGSPLNDTQSS